MENLVQDLTLNVRHHFKKDFLLPLLVFTRKYFNFYPLALDPLFIGDASVSSGFDLKLFKLMAYGASNFKIDKVRVVLEKVKVFFEKF